MQKWEYLFWTKAYAPHAEKGAVFSTILNSQSIPHVADWMTANKLGDDGWELVAAIPDDTPYTKYIFKRPKS